MGVPRFYHFHTWHRKKSAAKKEAQRVRDRGGLARVIKVSTPGRLHPGARSSMDRSRRAGARWIVYARRH